MFCVALPYDPRPAGSPDSETGVRYARYLNRSQDYHEDIPKRIEELLKEVASEWEKSDLSWKICVDTSAVLERSWAALCGLGWIGKNTLLIHPQLGSYLFLGVALLNQAVFRSPDPLPHYCGNCTRCLTRCPTQAFVEPGVLNSNSCISYWTLEKRGELSLSAEQRRSIQTWVAGCDLCQEVCPFNTKASRCPPSEDGRVPNATHFQTWEELLQEDELQYKVRINNSALNRIKPAQFSRNLALALSSRLTELESEPAASGVQSQSENLSQLIEKIQKRIERETDPVALKEWQLCLRVAYRRLESMKGVDEKL
ncbi:epoxyqueuosine reductase [bacterium]|nr:epoxyqueuosine reductase [bacterium]